MSLTWGVQPDWQLEKLQSDQAPGSNTRGTVHLKMERKITNITVVFFYLFIHLLSMCSSCIAEMVFRASSAERFCPSRTDIFTGISGAQPTVLHFFDQWEKRQVISGIIRLILFWAVLAVISKLIDAGPARPVRGLKLLREPCFYYLQTIIVSQ